MTEQPPNKQQFNYTKKEKIERLRRRLANTAADPKLVAIIKAILDLLEDEL